jgi:hypothetical protein
MRPMIQCCAYPHLSWPFIDERLQIDYHQ